MVESIQTLTITNGLAIQPHPCKGIYIPRAIREVNLDATILENYLVRMYTQCRLSLLFEQILVGLLQKHNQQAIKNPLSLGSLDPCAIQSRCLVVIHLRYDPRNL